MVYGKQMVHISDCFKDEEHRKWWQFASQDETDDETIIRRVVRDAREGQVKYRDCAQSCLSALVLHLGLGGRDLVVSMSTFAGGFGRNETCGALMGGIAALGLEFGRVDFAELGGPRSKGHSTFTLSQARATELIDRWEERTGGEIHCGDLGDKHFGKRLTPLDRSSAMEVQRLLAGEIFSMWSTFACELVALAAEIACEMILRWRRRKGIVTPLLPMPYYNRVWESQYLTDIVNPPTIVRPKLKM